MVAAIDSSSNGRTFSEPAFAAGAGVAQRARHCAVGAEPRISVTGSHEDATRSSAMEAGFGAPRVSQTLSVGSETENLSVHVGGIKS